MSFFFLFTNFLFYIEKTSEKTENWKTVAHFAMAVFNMCIVEIKSETSRSNSPQFSKLFIFQNV